MLSVDSTSVILFDKHSFIDCVDNLLSEDSTSLTPIGVCWIPVVEKETYTVLIATSEDALCSLGNFAIHEPRRCGQSVRVLSAAGGGMHYPHRCPSD
jgi:hypothetical protein